MVAFATGQLLRGRFVVSYVARLAQELLQVFRPFESLLVYLYFGRNLVFTFGPVGQINYLFKHLHVLAQDVYVHLLHRHQSVFIAGALSVTARKFLVSAHTWQAATQR